jgi:hypothetical protein
MHEEWRPSARQSGQLHTSRSRTLESFCSLRSSETLIANERWVTNDRGKVTNASGIQGEKVAEDQRPRSKFSAYKRFERLERRLIELNASNAGRWISPKGRDTLHRGAKEYSSAKARLQNAIRRSTNCP